MIANPWMEMNIAIHGSQGFPMWGSIIWKWECRLSQTHEWEDSFQLEIPKHEYKFVNCRGSLRFKLYSLFNGIRNYIFGQIRVLIYLSLTGCHHLAWSSKEPQLPLGTTRKYGDFPDKVCRNLGICGNAKPIDRKSYFHWDWRFTEWGCNNPTMKL